MGEEHGLNGDLLPCHPAVYAKSVREPKMHLLNINLIYLRQKKERVYMLLGQNMKGQNAPLSY